MSIYGVAWALDRVRGVSVGAKIVLISLAEFANEQDVTWVSRERLISRVECSPRALSGYFKELEACGALGVGQVRDVPVLTAPTWPRRSGRDDSSVDEPQVVHGFVDGFEGEVPVAGLGNLRQLPCGPIELLLCDVVVGSIDGESPVALRLNEPFAGGIHADDLLLVVLHLVCRRLAPPQYHRKPARARLSGACAGPRGGEQC